MEGCISNPAAKQGKPTNVPGNLRPISLLSSVGKLAEKVINRLTRYDTKFKITQVEQFGFRQGHDTTQQITRIVTDITNNFNKDNITQLTLLDIRKAFDRVWIQGLIAKLLNTKIPMNLIKLLQSYLTNRTLIVKTGNSLSTTRSIKAGVPQGSILRPKLFSLFIHDIPQFKHTNLALYADDTAVYARSFYADVANKQVQMHMNVIENYYDDWLVEINQDKTEIVLFSRKYTNNKIIT